MNVHDGLSESSSESSSENETVKLMTEIKSLKKTIQNNEEEISRLKRELHLANELRIQHKQNSENFKKEVSDLSSKIKSLRYIISGSTESNAVSNETKEKSTKSRGKAKALQQRKAKGRVLDNEVINDEVQRFSNTYRKQSNFRWTIKAWYVLNCPQTLTNIDLGHHVKINDESFRKYLKDNHLDIENATKNLTSMVWSRSERLARSLEGQRCNRYKNKSPKQPATSVKVHVVLGHMLKEGDKEGPIMASTLKTCAKDIGEKFAEDAYNKV
ncbi:Rho-associated protein kinase 1 [Frankliniella fusca]|uniref:Rho-associated protein kinase 1 n=1 Tax=Frankliniella fusca TaxID=407009 RepID=A0AAE1I1S8_9NEOP|nr:Rho-associated protein kinase 1 [Frankliniella fusca]